MKFKEDGDELPRLELLAIPQLELNDSSESLFRNVIAFEQTYTYLNIIFYDSESSQERVNDIQTICLHS